MEFIDGMPINSGPEAFGLHSNANISSAMAETYAMCDTILSIQASAKSEGGISREELIGNIASNIETRLPPIFDTHMIAEKHPVLYEESMNTVLGQECIRYNKLIAVMAQTLPQLQKALKGLVVMSGDLEKMCNAMSVGQVPVEWTAAAYPSMKPLNAWVDELMDRLDFITEWIKKGIPVAFWITGFYFPQAFLTGSTQNFARKYQYPIDTISSGYKVLDVDHKEIANKPEDGIYIYGLYLEGARWNKETGSLDDSVPKQLYTEVPVMHLMPEQNRKPTTEGVYRLPVYKILSRRGVLATTGHSSNFVMWVEIPSNRRDIINNKGESDQDTWVKAGVAAFCSLRY
jgi:dynein heavy chain